MRTIFCFIGIFPWLLNPAFHSSLVQTWQPDVSHTLKINDKLYLDGKLTEWCWQRAVRISNFTQRELNEKEPATERTEIAAAGFYRPIA